MLVSDQLRTYPSPNPKLTPNCYQLIVVGLREGWVGSQLLRNLHTSVLSGSHRDLMITWKRLGPIPEPKFSCFVIAFYPIQKYH